MNEFGLDPILDLLVTLASVVGAVGFTALGFVVDRAGLSNLVAGAMAQGAWELWMGTLALFVGLYLFGYRTALPALANRR